MDEPWGINGPDFLALYGALLLAPALVSLVWWQLQKRRSRPGAAPTGLSTYQLAWLAGGPVRAAQTAFVTLLERGAVRIGSSGFLTRVDEEAGEPLEKEALSAAKRQHVAHAVRATSLRSHCNRIGDGLIDAGLLVPYAETERRLRVTRWLYLGVLAVGVVRLVNGVRLGYPVGYLVLLLVVGVLAVGLIGRRMRRHRPGRTALGDQVLETERPSGAAATVALSGFAAHPDADTRAALTSKAPPEPRLQGANSGGASWAFGGFVGGGYGGSSCSSGGGSSCGGGGGGGGGCGGGGS